MDPTTDPILIIMIGAAVLAAVTFLRVLAIHREHEVNHHELVREIKRVRAEYERKTQSDDDDEIIV